MTRFFTVFMLCCGLFMIFVSPLMAMGVTDFVAVADGPSGVAFNPAGLTDLSNTYFYGEHCFYGRAETDGFDDLLVYSMKNQTGAGALFLTYSQDQVGPVDYIRETSYGYGFAWSPREKLNLGIALKFYEFSLYDDSLGTMLKYASDSRFMIDLGAKYRPSEHLSLGFAFQNIGKDDSFDYMDYKGGVGAAYQLQNWLLAAEVYDMFNQNPQAGAIFRVGTRPEWGSFRIHLIAESSDWGYQSQLAGCELISGEFSVGLFYHRTKIFGDENELVNASLGYRF